MKITATTEEGSLISASEIELRCIVQAATGRTAPNASIAVGVTLPAIDYAVTIEKARLLRENHWFNKILEGAEQFNKDLGALKAVVDKSNQM